MMLELVWRGGKEGIWHLPRSSPREMMRNLWRGSWPWSSIMPSSAEKLACTPVPVDRATFNRSATIPYGLTVNHIAKAMEEFVDFLGFINGQLNSRDLQRMETMMMPANFSSIVGEFIISAIPKHCRSLVRNEYHLE